MPDTSYSVSIVTFEAADPLALAKPHWIVELFLESGVRRVSDDDVQIKPASTYGLGYGQGGYGEGGYGG